MKTLSQRRSCLLSHTAIRIEVLVLQEDADCIALQLGHFRTVFKADVSSGNRFWHFVQESQVLKVSAWQILLVVIILTVLASNKLSKNSLMGGE